MGFPDSFRIPVSDTQAYKQFGNSVAVPVIAEVARNLCPHLLSAEEPAARPRSRRISGRILVPAIAAT
jgi:DNA (cytosine-5)-methyltransferase 1